MREIPLTHGQVALVDDEDYDLLTIHKWSALKAQRQNRVNFYAVRTVTADGQQDCIYMHRVVIGAADGQKVDHKNGNGCDNQKSNLRFANSSQNVANQIALLRANKSGYRGVYWAAYAKRWRAQLGGHGARVHLGYFDDPLAAARAYDRAAVAVWGEFARPNLSEVP